MARTRPWGYILHVVRVSFCSVHSHDWCDSDGRGIHPETSEGYHHTVALFFLPPPHHISTIMAAFLMLRQCFLWSLGHKVGHRWLIFTASLCCSGPWDLRGLDHVSFMDTHSHWCLFCFWLPWVFLFCFRLPWVFVAVRGLSLIAASRGYSLIAVLGHLTVVASLITEHRLSSHGTPV